MPPSAKSGVGVYEERGVLTTGQPCLSLNPSPQSLHPVQLFGRHSWLKTRPKQAEWEQIAYETEPSWRLPDQPDGVRPSHHPSLHCPHPEDTLCLLQCLILTFLARDMLLQRLKTAILVTVAALYGPLRRQKVSNGKTFFPPGTVTLLAWWRAHKKLHFIHTGQSYGGSKSNLD